MASNFPNGFANGVTIRGLPLQQLHPGEVFWVNSTSVLPDGADINPSNGNDGSFFRPFKTIDYAIGKCTADRGDIIIVMPGYTETLANATSLVMDVAGIAIVGLGIGSLRPTLTFSATGSNIPITAENMSITNVICESTVTDCVAAFTATGTATPKNLTIDNCYFVDTSATKGFKAIVAGNATAGCLDYFNFLGNRIYQLDATAATTCIKVIKASDHVTLADNYYVGPALNDTAALATLGDKVMLDFTVRGNKIFRPSTSSTGGTLFSGSGVGTGLVYDNYVWHLDNSGGLMVTVSQEFGFFQNFCPITAAADKSALINPAASA